MSRILVVEDEVRIASFVSAGLTRRGFRTDVARTGAQALELVREGGIDLIVLDIGLPGMDGFEVLRRIRSEGWAMPVIVLTARGSVADRVTGLEEGADDYMPKPFSMAELLARIRRRLATATPGDPVAAGDDAVSLVVGAVRLDLRTRQVRVHQRVADLSAREFALLEALMRHPGQVQSREDLLRTVWQYAHAPATNVVDVYAGYLRRKLGPGVIETVRGVGFRIGDPAPDASALGDPAPGDPV